MNSIMGFFQAAGEIVKLLAESIYWCKSAISNRRKVFEQMAEIGNNSVAPLILISIFIGGGLALNAGPTFALFGLEANVGGIVAEGMIRELGPIMASILVAGRAGSAMTAEIASMSVYQEIDALKTMDINPVRYLVMPRFLATFLTLPILVIFADIIGVFGGSVVATLNNKINVPFAVYYQNIHETVRFVDLLNGLIKAVVFGIIISMICCYVGLNTKGGPREIGSAVTKSVVLSFILVVIFDYFVTRFFVLIGFGYQFSV